MKCRRFANEAALAAALGRIVVDAVTRRPETVLGLPTGRTPLLLYEELIRLSRDEDVDWSQVHTFNLDEFVGLGPGDAGSYRSFMQRHLFGHLNVREDHVGFLDGRAADPEKECARYERAIEEAGGLDLLILGIGANGHIGFNEPANELTARTHRVTLVEKTRRANAWWFDDDVARVPHDALTMGMATILSARSIVLIATGEGKRDAVRAMLHGGVTTAVPASFLQLHPQVSVMLDASLADQLS